MGHPWLSVIVPTFNGAAYLTSALNSILAQRDPRIEIIVIDDGSTDETIPLLQSYRDKLCLRLVQRQHSGNWVANTNVGLGLARGDWVCFLHQDDQWSGFRLARLKEAMANYPDADFLLHSSFFIDQDGHPQGLWRCPLPSGVILDPRLVSDRLLVQNFIALPAPLFRREAALKVEGLREDLWYTADWDFWLKLAAVSKTTYLAKPLCGFRIHPHSQTVRRSTRSAAFRRQLEIVLENHLGCSMAAGSERREILRVARFSVEMNAFLAAAVHGRKMDWLSMAFSFLALGPGGCHRFLRDSRIAERVSARLRAGLSAGRAANSFQEQVR